MARWQNRILPTVPVVDWGDPICSQQRAWWLGNGSGSRLVNLISPSFGRGTLLSGASFALDQVGGFGGRVLALDGTANSYIDMSSNDVIADVDAPFSMQWLEYVASGYPAFPGVACFYPARNASGQRWLMFRSDNASYNSLAFALGSSGSMRRAAGAPSLASSVGLWRQWLISSPSGLGNGTNSWRVWCDGVEYAVSAGSALSSQTSQLNYLGWDGADNTWLGRMANVRIWARSQGSGDAARLFANPWAGLRSGVVLVPGAASSAAALHRMLLAL